MPNPYKNKNLDLLRNKFGELRKFSNSQSLFIVGDNAARLYFRYSKVHPRGRTFFGLREVDLRQLEGHNSFICFLVDDGSPPIFIPYSDFEQLFRNAQPDVLERSLNTKNLHKIPDFSHSQVQTLIAGIGHIKGYDVFVPENNVSNLDWSLTKRFRVLPNIPRGFDVIKPILSEIDVIWVTGGKNSIEGLFEVEHSTPIYSGLLRFNDVRLTDPNISQYSIVSSDSRRELFSRQVFRPAFIKSGLAELVSFFEYINIFDWHDRIIKEQKKI